MCHDKRVAFVLSLMPHKPVEAEFSFRNFPANGLDENGLVKDYEDSLSELKTIAKRFSKAVRTLGSLNNLEPGLLETWKSKLTKFTLLNVIGRKK